MLANRLKNVEQFKRGSSIHFFCSSAQIVQIRFFHIRFLYTSIAVRYIKTTKIIILLVSYTYHTRVTSSEVAEQLRQQLTTHLPQRSSHSIL